MNTEQFTSQIVLVLIAQLPLCVVCALGFLMLRALQRLHVLMNSRLTELLVVTGREARAQGKAEERSAQDIRDQERDTFGDR